MSNRFKAALFGTLAAAFVTGSAQAQTQPEGYQGAPRTELFNPALTSCIHDTVKYKKAPPYTIGFSNAGLGDSWRVVALDELKQGAEDHKERRQEAHHY